MYLQGTRISLITSPQKETTWQRVPYLSICNDRCHEWIAAAAFRVQGGNEKQDTSFLEPTLPTQPPAYTKSNETPPLGQQKKLSLLQIKISFFPFARPLPSTTTLASREYMLLFFLADCCISVCCNNFHWNLLFSFLDVSRFLFESTEGDWCPEWWAGYRCCASS